MKHTINLDEKYFYLIKEGKKIFELRLFDEKRKLIDIGDDITIKFQEESFKKTVFGLVFASDFNELCLKMNPEDAGFENKDELIKTMESFYSKDKQKKFGVVGIKLRD